MIKCCYKKGTEIKKAFNKSYPFAQVTDRATRLVVPEGTKLAFS